MKRDKGIQYLFWMYGDLPKAKTAERRMYETEKMEWNDFVKVKTDAYDQDAVLRWVRTHLFEEEEAFSNCDTYIYRQETISSEMKSLLIISLFKMVILLLI